jgi:hypothetical protein
MSILYEAAMCYLIANEIILLLFFLRRGRA